MPQEQSVEELKKIIADQDIEIKVLRKLVSMIKGAIRDERIDDLRAGLRKRFESASEQLCLFDEAETAAVGGAMEETPPGQEVVVESYVRRKSRAGVELPKDTPVVDVYDDSGIPGCGRCGSEMEEAGEKVYETFTRIQRTVVVRRHVRQFACARCVPENPGEGRTLETAPTGNILDGTVCDPTLLAQIIENKFGYAQPLYRQALSFRDIGLGRATMCSWIMRVGRKIVDNMAPCLEKDIEGYPLLNVDETVLKVVDLRDADGGKKAPHSRSNAFMVIRAATDSGGRSGPVLFTFTDNRRNETILDLLGSYKGAVQTDGLAGYSNAEGKAGFTHLGCMVHARRKAVDACGKRKDGPCYELVLLYAKFFHEEGILRDRYMDGSINEREYLSERRRTLAPLLEEIRAFCAKNVGKSVPSTAAHTAFNYPLERWDTLVRFLDYSYATSWNQKAENGIRPFAVGRKNWLFCITELGAEVSAFFYSLIESCKAMGIDAQEYLTYLFFHCGGIKNGDEKRWTLMLPDKVDRAEMGKFVSEYREKLFSAKTDPSRNEPYRLRGKRV